MKYLILILNIAFSQLYLELVSTDFDKPIYVISNPDNSDIIYVVENGEIVASGMHDKLLDNSEIYKNFYEKQLRKDWCYLFTDL